MIYSAASEKVAVNTAAPALSNKADFSHARLLETVGFAWKSSTVLKTSNPMKSSTAAASVWLLNAHVIVGSGSFRKVTTAFAAFWGWAEAQSVSLLRDVPLLWQSHDEQCLKQKRNWAVLQSPSLPPSWMFHPNNVQSSAPQLLLTRDVQVRSDTVKLHLFTSFGAFETGLYKIPTYSSWFSERSLCPLMSMFLFLFNLVFSFSLVSSKQHVFYPSTVTSWGFPIKASSSF